ncbi:MAG: hypothetical protein ABI327_10660 [Burkholderiaceae bacterium]
MLQRPDRVLLDESTSALDETAERDLYDRLRTQCPATTVVRIGHRSTLSALHARHWIFGASSVRNDAGVESVRRDAAPRAATHSHGAADFADEAVYGCPTAQR